MIITLDSNKIFKQGLSLEEALFMYFIKCGKSIREVHDSLVEKGFIDSNNNIISNGEKTLYKAIPELNNSINYIQLAKKLQELYPAGKKDGTPYMWRDSTVMIAKKLETLVKKYACVFTEEDAVEVTRKYIESFNGNYTYMKLLKYFLLKTEHSHEGTEVVSEFMSLLENKDQDTSSNQEWTVELK